MYENIFLKKILTFNYSLLFLLIKFVFKDYIHKEIEFKSYSSLIINEKNIFK